MKILLLEDDEILGEIIEEFLLNLNYCVDLFVDGEEAEDALYKKKFDILVLDVNVPSLDGFTLVQNLREQKIYTPAIFITSLNTSRDLEKGFAVGGDDYIKKPFELEELRVRIDHIKRVHKIQEGGVVEIFPEIIFDRKNFLLKDEKISSKEADILDFLYKKRGEIVTKEEVFHNVYAYEGAPGDATLRTYIKNLRKILGAEAIDTVKGVGYRLNK